MKPLKLVEKRNFDVLYPLAVDDDSRLMHDTILVIEVIPHLNANSTLFKISAFGSLPIYMIVPASKSPNVVLLRTDFSHHKSAYITFIFVLFFSSTQQLTHSLRTVVMTVALPTS